VGRERPQPANAASDYKAIIPLIAAS
jgi:hypothetical protein